MMSFAFSMISTFVFHPMFLLGYAFCVLFPVPWLNRLVLDLWAKFGAQIMAWFRNLSRSAVTSTQTVVPQTGTGLSADALPFARSSRVAISDGVLPHEIALPPEAAQPQAHQPEPVQFSPAPRPL